MPGCVQRSAAVLATLALAAPAAAIVPPTYMVTVIDPPSQQVVNGVSTYPLGVNLGGRVVGYGYSTTGAMTPVDWQDGVLSQVGGPAYDRTFATSVNRFDHAVGAGYVMGPLGGIAQAHALKWVNGSATDLGNLGGHFAVPLAINSANDQIVGYSTLPGDTTVRAFSYANGHMTGFDTLPGATESYPYDITDNHYIVGAAVVDGITQPFRLRNGVVNALSVPAGTRAGAAYAANNIGAAVGTYEVDLNTGAHAGVLWRISGERVDLGNLGGSIPYTVAKDINNLGQVVGTSLAPGGFGGFFWQSGELFNLQNLILPEYAGIQIISANSINDNEQIAAAALINGRQASVLLTPIIPGVPAPATLMLMGGASFVAMRRRR
jgi:probable HAF family extracellular repeat protein